MSGTRIAQIDAAAGVSAARVLATRPPGIAPVHEPAGSEWICCTSQSNLIAVGSVATLTRARGAHGVRDATSRPPAAIQSASEATDV